VFEDRKKLDFFSLCLRFNRVENGSPAFARTQVWLGTCTISNEPFLSKLNQSSNTVLLKKTLDIILVQLELFLTKSKIHTIDPVVQNRILQCKSHYVSTVGDGRQTMIKKLIWILPIELI